jgi:biopolymer transport protein TolQ
LLGTFLMTATQQTSGEFDLLANILETRGMVLGVLIALVIMSVICWFIIAYKAVWFLRMRSASKRFVNAYWDAGSPNEVYELARESACPEGRVFVAGFEELGNLRNRSKAASPGGPLRGGFENVERAVRRTERQEMSRFESLIGFLGTTGSTAPFIGLFGTVWGIMMAFGQLGAMDESANLLTTVTPHIAEALVATAIGLLAAIPAVMAYNFFVRRTRIMITDLDTFSADYLNTVRRLYFEN